MFLAEALRVGVGKKKGRSILIHIRRVRCELQICHPPGLPALPFPVLLRYQGHAAPRKRSVTDKMKPVPRQIRKEADRYGCIEVEKSAEPAGDINLPEIVDIPYPPASA